MQAYFIDHYAAGREESLVAAAAEKLANASQHHIDAAISWQRITDRPGSGGRKPSVSSPS